MVWRCNGCDAERGHGPDDMPQTPCPACGETAFTYHLARSDSAYGTESPATTSMIPDDRSRDWQGRWADIQSDVVRLLAPRTEPRSEASIRAAERELLDFYVHAYHLKDQLIEETTVLETTIEAAINAAPQLALLADLANLWKHGKLKRTRSGHFPVLGERQGTSTAGSWHLELPIHHGPNVRDGLDVARDSVAAWRLLLQRWGLI